MLETEQILRTELSMCQKKETSATPKDQPRDRFVVTLDVPKDIPFQATFHGKGNEDPTRVTLRVDTKRGG